MLKAHLERSRVDLVYDRLLPPLVQLAGGQGEQGQQDQERRTHHHDKVALSLRTKTDPKNAYGRPIEITANLQQD